MFVDHINDPAGIHRPKSKMRYYDGNISAKLDRRIGPTQVDPRHIEHLPFRKRALCSFKDLDTLTQLDSIVVDDIPLWSFSPRTSNVRIRERLFLLNGEKCNN
jgi:hypothetical protein